VLLLVRGIPLHALGRDARRLVGEVLEHHLPDRQHLEAPRAHDADVELAAVDVALDDRVGVLALVDERDALLELLVRIDDRQLRDAGRALLRERLHDQRERELLRPHDRVPMRNTWNSGTGMRW
jgi:hypothetical protein